MTTYIVAHDLHEFSQNHEALLRRLSEQDGYARIHQSAWIVRSSRSLHELRRHMR